MAKKNVTKPLNSQQRHARFRQVRTDMGLEGKTKYAHPADWPRIDGYINGLLKARGIVL